MDTTTHPTAPPLQPTPDPGLRIAMLAPIAWRTPPTNYGPWEQVASTLAADGRAIAVDRYATVLGVQGTSVVSRLPLNGLTAARPAASLSYV